MDCWKEIATYLGRGERTVKRWETERGLPIRRVPGGGRSSVYAFSAELDEWLKSSHPEATDAGKESQPGPSLGNVYQFGAEPPAEIAQPVLSPPVISPVVHLPVNLKDKGESSLLAAMRGRRWILACAGLLLLGLSTVGWKLPAVRRSASSVLSSGSEARSAKKASSSAPPISDEEKQVARELYLKGRYEWNQRTPDSLERALDSFTQAIVHDPGYAEAYVGLADTYDLLREYSQMPEDEAFSRATAAARKAIELDDSLAEGHRALAFAEMYGSWDFRDAEKEFRRAIALNPKDPVAHRWYANAIAVAGRYEESLQEIDKAQELDPTSNSTLADKGIMLFNAGRKQEAIALLEQVEHSAPEFQSPHKYLMRIDFETENYPLYLSEGKTLAALSGDTVLKEEISQAQAGFARAGKNGLLPALYAKQREDHASGKILETSLAQTCMQMGKRQEAMQLLEEGYAHHDEYAVAASLSDPILLRLKDEPDYQAYRKKINFPAKTSSAAPGPA